MDELRKAIALALEEWHEHEQAVATEVCRWHLLTESEETGEERQLMNIDGAECGWFAKMAALEAEFKSFFGQAAVEV